MPFQLKAFGWAPAFMSWLTHQFMRPQRLMFGRGVYFADDPCKSWKHAAEICDGPHIGSRYILACKVKLGNSRLLQEPANHLTSELMHRRCIEGFLYDSITGLGREAGGVLRRKEYVVFDTHQAIP